MPYIPHTPEEVREMLDVVGVASIDELFAEIPDELRPSGLDLPAGMTEMAVRSAMEGLASKNRTDMSSFLGGGFYDHYVPSASDMLISRGEFATAYTPYPPEASQGTLQAIFEYQTAVTRLFDMDCSNAGVYDGGTALYEAVMMAVRHTRRKTVVGQRGRQTHLPHLVLFHLHQKKPCV
jgi:glycine dehydrogenase subunit 1